MRCQRPAAAAAAAGVCLVWQAQSGTFVTPGAAARPGQEQCTTSYPSRQPRSRHFIPAALLGAVASVAAASSRHSANCTIRRAKEQDSNRPRPLRPRHWTEKSEFVELKGAGPAAPRGSVKAKGKKAHFHLLDRFIRRVDDLMPEEMEHLVTPLNSHMNLETTSRTLKLTFPLDASAPDVTEEDVYEFFHPIEPVGILVGLVTMNGETQVLAHFATNEACRAGRKFDGKSLGSTPVAVRYSDDRKWEKLQQRGLLDKETLEKLREEKRNRAPQPKLPESLRSRGRWRAEVR